MRYIAKRIIGKTLNRFGYTIHKTKSATVYSPYGHSIFAPWLESKFQEEIYSKIRDHTVVSADRCYIIDRLCRHCAYLKEGDFAECGVYKAGTAYLIANAIKASGRDKHLHLFDTFTGMPDTAIKERDGHQKGDFGDTSLDSVKSYLADFPYVTIHAGFIPTTFENVKNEWFSFVHIDVDIYQTSLDCCEFFYSRLVSGAVVIFDDYGFTKYKDAEKRVVDEFFADKPETLISLPTGQCIIIKL